jgi:hypothetical protein
VQNLGLGKKPAASTRLALPEPGGKARKWCNLGAALWELWRFGAEWGKNLPRKPFNPQSATWPESFAGAERELRESRLTRPGRTQHASPPQTGASPPQLNRRLCRWKDVRPESEKSLQLIQVAVSLSPAPGVGCVRRNLIDILLSFK